MQKCDRCGTRHYMFRQLPDDPFGSDQVLCPRCYALDEIKMTRREVLEAAAIISRPDSHFILNKFKGNIAQSIVEAVLLSQGYDVYPAGYETYLYNLIRYMGPGYGNEVVTKVRHTPDLFAFDPVERAGYFFEIKGSNFQGNTFHIEQGDLDAYIGAWPGTRLVIVQIQTCRLFCGLVENLRVKIDQGEIVTKQVDAVVGGSPAYLIDVQKSLQPFGEFLNDTDGVDNFLTMLMEELVKFRANPQ